MSTTSGAIGASTATAARRDFRIPLGLRLLSLFGVVVLAGMTGLLAVFAILLVRADWRVSFVVAAEACLMGALTDYVWRDFAGKWRLRVVLGTDAVTLDLPAGRSLIHRPPAQHLTVPFADIAAVESRLEGFRSFGMESMQRAYVLRRKDNELIFLFEDRALGTALESSLFTGIAAALAARAGGTVHDIGMVAGKGGVLGVWGTHAPDWPAAPLSAAERLAHWRRAAMTGSSVFIIIIVALAIRLLAGG
ncbi:MAG TPA: hypothetical protein VK591_12690 [Xanthobacteraceae bacterium]|nr:hypothetical protein [Xanthobacteraceae bacterium]